MKQNDIAIRRGAAGIVTAVGLFAGTDSYVHVYGLARDWHNNIIAAAFLPLTADGVVLAASAVKLIASKRNDKTPASAHAWFWTGTLATLAGNGASGWPHGAGAALLSLWPVLAYIGCMEMLTWMMQNLGPQPKRAASPVASRPAIPVASRAASSPAPIGALVPPVTPEPGGAPQDGPRTYAPRRPLDVLLAEAEAKFAGDLTAAQLPGIRKIQTTVNVGPGRADLIRKHLETVLAAAASLSFA